VSDALTRVVLETEQLVGASGWDQPPRVYSLVRTAALLEREPTLTVQLFPDAADSIARDPGHLTAVEQEGLPESETLEEMLAQLAWGPDVDGVTLSVERLVVPPDAERDLPDDPQAAVQYLAAHPSRHDVRLVVGVLRDGTAMCALRQREHDDVGSVAVGPDLVPGLIAALQATFED
jgi:hypothetical protein